MKKYLCSDSDVRSCIWIDVTIKYSVYEWSKMYILKLMCTNFDFFYFSWKNTIFILQMECYKLFHYVNW